MGNRLWPGWHKKCSPLSAAQAKSRAILEAAAIARCRKWESAINHLLRCKTNRLSAINNLQQPPWDSRTMVMDIIVLLHSFASWACKWIPRSQNICTHQLCQLGKRHCSPDLTGLHPFEGYPVPLLVDEWIKILPIQKRKERKEKLNHMIQRQIHLTSWPVCD